MTRPVVHHIFDVAGGTRNVLRDREGICDPQSEGGTSHQLAESQCPMIGGFVVKAGFDGNDGRDEFWVDTHLGASIDQATGD